MANDDFQKLLDRDAAHNFVQLVTGQDDPVVRVRFIHDQNKNAPSGEARGTIDQLWPQIIAAQEGGFGVSWLPNLCDFAGDGFARDTDATGFPALFCDFDGALPEQWHRQPDLIVHTSPGHGHTYWLIAAGAAADEWKHGQRRLINYYTGADPAIKNPSRLMRLPGTLHQKRGPFLVTFTNTPDPDAGWLGRSSIAAVLEGIPDVAAASVPKQTETDVPEDDPRNIEEAKRVIARFKPAIEGQRGDDRTYKLCARLRRDLKLSTDAALELLEPWNAKCEPPWSEDELRAKLEHADEYGQNEPGSGTPKAANEIFPPLPSVGRPAVTGDFGGVRFERMSDVALEKITWTWYPRIPAGMLSIIGGDPDCGKSTLVAGLIAAITTGGPLPLNGGNAEKGSVLVLNAEDGAAKVLGPRLAAADADMKLVHRVKPMVAFDDGARVFDLRFDLPALEAKMQQLREADEPPVRLITIDPLNAYYGAGVDGNNAAELRRLLTPLAEWAENNHITILGIHHLNKSNASGNAINRLNGSHAVGAAARSVILVTPERGDDGQETGRFLFMRGKNNLAPRNVKNLAYRIEARAVTMHDGSLEDHPVAVWDSEVAITAAEAFDPNYGKGSKQHKAEAFLLAALADGPVAVGELKRMAAERGLGWRTVETVKVKLSIRTDHKGFGRNSGWFWRLRNKEAEDAANDVNRVPVDPDDELLYPATLQ